ncbi:MAG: hypothetical protein IPH51_10500 [Rubrivivax sp.]|nr:hypothetical protein [Rubrivivax sp.]
MRLLIVGDSTAVGTGASSPQSSLAGLLAQTFPDLHIENRSRDGATFDAIEQQLGGDGHFDMVLVQAGGNDVIRLRDLDAVRQDIARVTRCALERADRVVLMPAGNVGNAPFFFPPVSWLMTSRARGGCTSPCARWLPGKARSTSTCSRSAPTIPLSTTRN